MADNNNNSKLAVVLSAVAAAGGWAAFLKANTQSVAAAGGPVTLDPAILDLLTAWAQTTEDIDSVLAQILADLPGSPAGGTVYQYPPNLANVTTSSVQVQLLTVPVRMPDIIIPDGMELVIKASPLNAVGSLIYVARSQADAGNVNASWPLMPNEPISYKVKDANIFWIGSNVIGSIAFYTVEQQS